MLVCADVGLPIPNDPRRVDLTITPGISAVTEVLRVVLEENAGRKGHDRQRSDGAQRRPVAHLVPIALAGVTF